MICEICHQNEATIHVQEVLDGSKNTLNLCPVCAAQHNIGGDADMDGVNLAEMLYNISSQMLQANSGDLSSDLVIDSQDDSPEITCRCGWNTSKFREGGRLGCPECYNVFAPILVNALHSMHKGASHVGKHPVDAENIDFGERPTLTIMNLQKELEECVRCENYERAAELRDEINAIKTADTKDGKGEPAA